MLLCRRRKLTGNKLTCKNLTCKKLTCKKIGVAVLTLLISSCSSDHGEKVLSNYLYRLGNVLDQEVPPIASESVLRWPNAMVVQQAVNTSIDLLDFLSLYGCDLQLVVAEKNSNLGKLAQPSQKLLNDLRFIQSTPQCLGLLESEGKVELTVALRDVAEHKRSTFFAGLWQVVMGEGEAKSFWRASPNSGSYPDQVSSSVLLALGGLDQAIEKLAKGGRYFEQVRLSSQELEGWLFELNRGDGGDLYRALMKYQRHLRAANEMLRNAKEGGCDGIQVGLRNQRLENVVQKFFVGEVQQWASALSRRYYELMPVFESIEQRFSEVEPADYKAWRQQRNQDMAVALESAKAHVSLIQSILDDCGAKS